MAHIPERWDGVNQWYFVTVVTLHREPIFREAAPCRMLMAAFKEARQYYEFRLAALVIMHDHWHGLIRPDNGVVIEQVVVAVKKNVLRGMNRFRNTIWQTQFLDHRIRNERDFAQHVEYIRMNPVKHEYVAAPEAYEWCFIHPRPFG